MPFMKSAIGSENRVLIVMDEHAPAVQPRCRDVP